MTPDARIHDRLTAIERTQRETAALLAKIAALLEPRRRAGAVLSGHQREALALVLPVLGDKIGPRGRFFTTAEALADIQDRDPDVAARLMAHLGAQTPRGLACRFGHLLAAACGQSILGLRVEDTGAQAHRANLWHIGRQ